MRIKSRDNGFFLRQRKQRTWTLSVKPPTWQTSAQPPTLTRTPGSWYPHPHAAHHPISSRLNFHFSLSKFAIVFWSNANNITYHTIFVTIRNIASCKWRKHRPIWIHHFFFTTHNSLYDKLWQKLYNKLVSSHATRVWWGFFFFKPKKIKCFYFENLIYKFYFFEKWL